MQRYLVIADDFTGANDTGLQFARRSIPTRVQIKRAAPLSKEYSLVLDTESRNIDEQQARKQVRDALSGLDLSAFSVIMKKIDSTLRGNVAAEVAQLRTLIDADIVVVAVAFPPMGRTTVDATVLLNGIALLQTEVGKDPRKPIATDNLLTLFGELDERIVHLQVDTIREGSFPSLKRGVVICDSIDNTDLDLVAAWALSLEARVLFVGSAGLADALVNQQRRPKPSLAVVASLSEVTAAQVRHSQESGAVVVALPVPAILEEKPLDHLVQRASSLLAEGHDVIVTVSSVLEREDIEAGTAYGLSSDEVGTRLMDSLSRVGKQIIDDGDISGVVLTGGDTAYGSLEALGITEFEIEGEVALGIPRMRALGAGYEGLKIITKAGGFGSVDAISYALRALKEEV